MRVRALGGLAATLGATVLLLLPGGGGGTALADQTNINPLDPILDIGDRFVPRAPGTKEKLKFFYGPYPIPPGWDMNRIDLTLPLRSGMVTSVEPGMRLVADGTEPAHQKAHIHHAHWFSLNPGNETDNYLGGLGDWIFGNGDEETRANFERAQRRRPEGSDLRRPHRARRAAADDLHAPQQDAGHDAGLDHARHHLRPRDHGGAQRARRRARLPRGPRRALRPHVRCPAQSEEQGRHVRDPGGRSRGPDRVDVADRRHADRHRQPPAPGRPARDHRELRVRRSNHARRVAAVTEGPSS